MTSRTFRVRGYAHSLLAVLLPLLFVTVAALATGAAAQVRSARSADAELRSRVVAHQTLAAAGASTFTAPVWSGWVQARNGSVARCAGPGCVRLTRLRQEAAGVRLWVDVHLDCAPGACRTRPVTLDAWVPSGQRLTLTMISTR